LAWPIALIGTAKKDLHQVFKYFQEGQSGCMQGACAASNACKVASSNGQPFGQKKKRQPKITILAHFGSQMATIKLQFK
jgi:hypothetical protein